MRLPHRLRIAASVLPLVLGSLAGAGPVSVAASAPSQVTVTDPQGDVRSDTGAPMEEPRADIVEATVDYRTDGIELRLKTAEPRDPQSDRNWDHGFTAVGWAIDTTGDSRENYQLEYGREGNSIYGAVYPPDAPVDAEPMCRALAADFRDGYYRVVADHNCLGTPEQFRFRALMLYTRDADDPSSPQAEDVVPDSGWAGPVGFPVDPGPDPGAGDPDPETGEAPPPAPPQGYWLVARDGGIFSYGSARFYGSTGHVRLNEPIVGMATRSNGEGYWFVAADGGVFAFGVPFYGSTGDIRLNRPIVGMAATPSGAGYWLVASDGGIFAFGDAGFYGSTGSLRLNRPIVGMAPTPSGAGYWLVASDGGIFAFGDAGFYGSTGDLRLNRPIVGMAATPSGRGYWFVADDGGVFSFGNAPFHGSGGSFVDASPVVGMSATKGGEGYRLVRADGSVAHYGRAQNKGSMGGRPLAQPIVGMAAAS